VTRRLAFQGKKPHHRRAKPCTDLATWPRPLPCSLQLLNFDIIDYSVMSLEEDYSHVRPLSPSPPIIDGSAEVGRRLCHSLGACLTALPSTAQVVGLALDSWIVVVVFFVITTWIGAAFSQRSGSCMMCSSEASGCCAPARLPRPWPAASPLVAPAPNHLHSGRAVWDGLWLA
jgi:hypothetical protein